MVRKMSKGERKKAQVVYVDQAKKEWEYIRYDNDRYKRLMTILKMGVKHREIRSVTTGDEFIINGRNYYPLLFEIKHCKCQSWSAVNNDWSMQSSKWTPYLFRDGELRDKVYKWMTGGDVVYHDEEEDIDDNEVEIEMID